MRLLLSAGSFGALLVGPSMFATVAQWLQLSDGAIGLLIVGAAMIAMRWLAEADLRVEHAGERKPLF